MHVIIFFRRRQRNVGGVNIYNRSLGEHRNDGIAEFSNGISIFLNS